MKASVAAWSILFSCPWYVQLPGAPTDVADWHLELCAQIIAGDIELSRRTAEDTPKTAATDIALKPQVLFDEAIQSFCRPGETQQMLEAKRKLLVAARTGHPASIAGLYVLSRTGFGTEDDATTARECSLNMLSRGSKDAYIGSSRNPVG